MKAKPKNIENDINDIVSLFGGIAVSWGADYNSEVFKKQIKEINKCITSSI